jgi:hypothetical protein
MNSLCRSKNLIPYEMEICRLLVEDGLKKLW